MMAHDVPEEDGTDSESEAACEGDCNRLVVDVVTLEAFLAALSDDNPPNERHLTLVRTPRPQIE